MDAETKEEFKKVFKNLDDQFGKVNERIDKMSEFMMTHAASKIDLKDMATKEDLQQVKSDILNKVYALAYGCKKLDDEKVATGHRLDAFELKTGIV
jgi:hypothetical protein